jgi:hypothetical protein
MYRCLLRVLTVSAVVLGAACATNPENRSSAADGHAAAARTHLEFARDFKEVGNDAMSQYHLEKARVEQEKQEEAECGLFCAIIDSLLGTEPDSNSISRESCRDPITNPPGAPPRC